MTSMTLNDLERRNSPYFAFFSPNSTDFQADNITVHLVLKAISQGFLYSASYRDET